MIREFERQNELQDEGKLLIPIPLKHINTCEEGDVFCCGQYDKEITEYDISLMNDGLRMEHFFWFLVINGNEITIAHFKEQRSDAENLEIILRSRGM